MADLGTLMTSLGADLGPLNRGVTQATGAFHRYQQMGVNALNRVKRSVFSLQGAFAALGIGMLGRSFLSAANTSEQFNVRLKVLLGSTEEGSKLFKSMADYASKVPHEYEKIMASATQLSGVMKGGVKEIEEWMPLIGDLAAATGLDIQKTTEQVIRMYSAGAASADLFRERGVLAMMGFKAGVSYNAEETRKMMMEAWQKADSQFRGATAELAKTWSGFLSMMSDKWFAFRNRLMEAGVFDFLKAGIGMFNDWLASMQKTGKFDAFAKDMGETLVNIFEKVIKGTALVGDAFRGWEMIWEGLKTVFSSFSILIAKGLDKLVFLLKKFYQGIIKVAELGAKLPGVSINEDVLQPYRQAIEDLGGVEGYAGKMQEFWKGVLSDSEDNLEGLVTSESYYSKAEKLVKAIQSRIEGIKKSITEGGKGRDSEDKTVGGTSTFSKEYQKTLNDLERKQKDFEFEMRQLDRDTWEQKRQEVYQWAEIIESELKKAKEAGEITKKEFKLLQDQIGKTGLAQLDFISKQKEKEEISEKVKELAVQLQEEEHYANEKLRTQEQLTDQINQLTLKETDYQIWAMNKEMDKLEEKYKNEKDIIDLIKQYRIAAEEEIMKKVEDTTDYMKEFQIQAYRNIQDAMAKFLFDPFENGIQGMLESFGKMIRQMVAQVMANKILTTIFGGEFGSGGSLGGGLGTLFGGGKAIGGSVSKGSIYQVNERGSEMLNMGGKQYLLPTQDGYITPAQKEREQTNVEVPITNIVDPQVARIYLASAQGQRDVLNIISDNAYYIRRSLNQ